MTKDEALRLALRAMVVNNQAWKHLADSGDAGYWEAEEQGYYQLNEQAIKAVESALEAKDEPVAWKETDELECPICKVKAYPYPKCGHVKYVDEQEAFENWLSRNCPSGDAESVQYQWASSSDYEDLYTTPPQRKPLTDEEIEAIWPLHTFIQAPDRQWLAFARAIEAAHGIKGEA
jgi:hypothetical protein